MNLKKINKMKKPVISLHIQTLIGKVEIVNVLLNNDSELDEMGLKQIGKIQEIITSKLLNAINSIQCDIDEQGKAETKIQPDAKSHSDSKNSLKYQKEFLSYGEMHHS
jgi:hypothetical protein